MFWLAQPEALIYITGERPLKPSIYYTKPKKRKEKAIAFIFHLQVNAVMGSSFKPEYGKSLTSILFCFPLSVHPSRMLCGAVYHTVAFLPIGKWKMLSRMPLWADHMCQQRIQLRSTEPLKSGRQVASSGTQFVTKTLFSTLFYFLSTAFHRFSCSLLC